MSLCCCVVVLLCLFGIFGVVSLLWTSLLCIMEDLPGGGSVAVFVGISDR